MSEVALTVYGSSGFIGTHFCNGRTDIFKQARKEIKPSSPRILYFISTISNYNVLTDPYIDIDTNLKHLVRVLEGLKELPEPEITFISSWFVYGETPDVPAREDSPCRPKGFYSITKLCAEQLLESYCKTFNIKYRIIRLGNVIGPSDAKASAKKNALQYLVDEMKQNNDIKLYNGGNFIRDYSYVGNIVEGINFLLDNGEYNQIYNLGSGHPTVFKDLIEEVACKLTYKGNITSMEPTDFHKIVQVKDMYLDISKLLKLGFKPTHKTSLSDILINDKR